VDLPECLGQGRTSAQGRRHRSSDCPPGRRKQLVGLQADLWGAEETGTPRLPQLRARGAPAPWPAACSRPQRAVVEAIHSGALGGHLGDGLLDRRGLDEGRIGDHLRSVLFASGHSPSLAGRLHAATACRLDGTTGQEFLYGRRGLGTTVSVSGP
jgi:hypothetical protein